MDCTIFVEKLPPAYPAATTTASNRTPATSTTSSTTTTQQQQQQQQQQEMKEKTKRQTGTESKDHYQLVWRESRIKKTNIKFNFFMMGRCTIRAPA
jgi:hypothetical protein